jgi:hypothetical protein
VRAASAIVAVLLAATPLAAQEQPPQQPRTHVVTPGETLWDLARRYLSDPFLWPEIFRLNVDVVRDPALIYPSQRLVIPGQAPHAAAPVYRVEYTPEVQEDARPRLELMAQAERPAVTEGDFYRASFVAREAEVPVLGAFAEREAQSVVRARMMPQVNLYDRVFVSLRAPDGVSIGERIHFVRPGRQLRPLGRVFQPTAVGTVAAVEGRTATVVVIGLYDQLRVGDLAVPMARFPLAAGIHPQESADLPARIFAFQDERPLQMLESILFLDVGRSAGVAVGDEFEAYLPREGRDWGTRPEIRVARMQVVRVTDASASVRVTNLDQPAIQLGLPVRRVARMP